MKFYIGTRTPAGTEVEVVDRADPQGGYDLRQEQAGPAYDWGDRGEGHARLAADLLADALGDEQRAKRLAHDFRHKVVGRLNPERWQLSEEDIRQAVIGLEQGRGR